MGIFLRPVGRFEGHETRSEFRGGTGLNNLHLDKAQGEASDLSGNGRGRPWRTDQGSPESLRPSAK
jgi:hypothetical protein